MQKTNSIFKKVPIKLIDLDPSKNIRSVACDVRELANSIDKIGLQNPPKIIATNKSGFDIIDGFNRLAAIQILITEDKWPKENKRPLSVLCEVITDKIDATGQLELKLACNIQREALNPLDEAKGFAKLIKSNKRTVADLSVSFGKSQEYIYSRINLLEMSEIIRAALANDKITISHAKEISRLPSHLHGEAVKKAEEYSVKKLAEWIEKKLKAENSNNEPGLPGTGKNKSDGGGITETISPAKLKTGFLFTAKVFGLPEEVYNRVKKHEFINVPEATMNVLFDFINTLIKDPEKIAKEAAKQLAKKLKENPNYYMELVDEIENIAKDKEVASDDKEKKAKDKEETDDDDDPMELRSTSDPESPDFS